MTKDGVDKTYPFEVLREASWCLVQNTSAAALKLVKSGQSAARKVAIDAVKRERRRGDKLTRASEVETFDLRIS